MNKTDHIHHRVKLGVIHKMAQVIVMSELKNWFTLEVSLGTTKSVYDIILRITPPHDVSGLVNRPSCALQFQCLLVEFESHDLFRKLLELNTKKLMVNIFKEK